MADKSNRPKKAINRTKAAKSSSSIVIAKSKRRIDVRYAWLLLFTAIVICIVYFRNYIDWTILKQYLDTLLAWPPIILVLGLVFMSRFKTPIETFLNRLDRVKAVGVELSQQQTAQTELRQAEEPVTDVKDELKKNADGSVTLTKDQVEKVTQYVEELEFKYLSLHLVQNTKNALKLMNDIEVQRNAFLQIYQVPQNTLNAEAERYAILEALTSNGLAVEDRGIMKITDKGVGFLRYEGII